MTPSQPSFVPQSVVFEDGRLQISWYDAAWRSPLGLEIRTAVINPADAGIDAEIAELHEAVFQVVLAWEGARREAATR